MIYVIFTIILGIVGGISLIVAAKTPEASASSRLGAVGIAGICALLWLIFTVAFSVHTVGQREVGIVHNFSGTITGKVDPGVAWTAPWQHVKKENVGIQREEFELGPGNSAVSKDQQPIYSRITLNYQVLPNDVVDLYKNVGPGWKATLLDSRVLQDFKEVTSKYTAQEITTQREGLRRQTRERLAAELGQYDIKVVDFFVKNIGYSKTYSDSIDAKNRQVQESLQAKAKVDQAQYEADQKIKTAEGKKQSTILEAQGEAQSIALKGRAIRKNPEVLKLTAIEKLSPQAQVVFCSGIACPSFLPAGFGK